MSRISRRDFVNVVGGAGARLLAATSGTSSAGRAASNASTTQPDTGETLGFRSARALVRMIRDKEISAVELTEYFIKRIERFDDRVNAVVVRDFDRALADAREADSALMRGEMIGPLHGLPMTIKESFNIAGLPTTWGIPAMSGNVATDDAAVVTQLRQAGAHFLGKANVPFALADFQAYNDLYGTTNNPWDLERVPGGSSGGSAAAVAAGLTGLDFGSDIGGSLRCPAHFCGVFAHKPTWGTVPMQGHQLGGPAAAPDLAVLGPLARSAEDLTVALDIAAGADILNAAGWRLQLPAPRARTLDRLRVAVWPSEPVAPPDATITDRVQAVADMLARQGAVVSDAARPAFAARDHHVTYLNLLNAFAAATVSDDVFAANERRAARFAVGDMSYDAVLARAAVLDHRSWLQHDNRRTAIRLQWREFFSTWDVLVCPIMVTPAFPHDHSPLPTDQGWPPSTDRTVRVSGVETPYFDQLFWSGLATLGQLPSTAFPVGRSADGLPIGLQVIGAEFDDRTTIEFARLVTQELGSYDPPPGYGD